MTILLATSNPHKIDELRAILADCAARTPGRPASIRLLSLADLRLNHLPEPVEDADTFEANALLKARYYFQHSGTPTLADDSGLEVDALHGRPGVRSARYAGLAGPRPAVDSANNRLLLQHLAEVPAPRRSARFVCAMALVGRTPEPITLRGCVEGRILLPHETADPDHPERGRGSHGFGYDPLFLIPDLGRTTAELEPQQKNQLSHRGRAARLLYQRLLNALPADQSNPQ